MNKKTSLLRINRLCLAVSIGLTGSVFAQEKAADDEQKQTQDVAEQAKISVVGSHIQRVKDTETLPVTVIDEEDIADTGAVSGDELLRNIPQVGEVSFNNERAVGAVNDARGDVNSINLRGLGTGNTLTLLNGRRLVLHPGTQSENYVPVTTVNSNTLPVAGLRNVQVLRDGAAAIYGSDAVAGVINYELKDNYNGHQMNLSYGSSEGVSLNQATVNYVGGFDLNDGNSHLTMSLSYYNRDGMMASERPYSVSDDRRQYPGLPEGFVGDTQLDNRSTATPWGEFSSSSLGRFHIQPDSMSGCVQDIGNGLCADRGSLSRSLRFNRAALRSMTSDVDRFNFYTYFTHNFDNVELFSEFFYYNASSERIREQSGNLTAQRFTIAADAAHNPFGEQVTLRRYRAIDAGNRMIEVDDSSYRFLTGLRGYKGNWDWETAVLHSAAKTADLSRNRIRASAFQAAINQTDPNLAYNPFNGGDPNNPNTADSTVNPQSVMNPFLVDVSRDSDTSLSLVDFKMSNGSLWEMSAGSAGIAIGVEYRRETYKDDRDSLLDGSSPFVDQVTGRTLSGSDVLGNSPTPDSEGSRNVISAYSELLIPLLSGKSWAEYVEMQLAARYEKFSNIGSALKPKLALSWQVNNWLGFRSAYAEGFRAPGLPQLFSEGVARSNTSFDPIIGRSYGVTDIRSGSRDLKPEDDVNTSFGVILQPTESLTMTVDWWNIEQEGVVGILPAQTHLLYDSLLRSQGSNNPAVIRDPNTNEVVQVNNRYMNLNPRSIAGIDFSVDYDLETSFGDWRFTVSAARLNKFKQDADPISAAVIAAQQAGNAATPADIVVAGAGDLMKQNGRPKWRARAAVKWRHKQWGAGLAYRYVSDFFDTSVTATIDSQVQLLPIDSYATIDGYVDYRIGGDNLFTNSRIRVGARNISDEAPPLADESFGYFSSVHSNRGRYLYVTFKHEF